MDELYNYHPFKGEKYMYTWLTMDKGYNIMDAYWCAEVSK